MANLVQDVINSSSVATIQQLNATGNVLAWGSIVEIGDTPLTANTVATIPACAMAHIGKSIILTRRDATAFTATLSATGADTFDVYSPTALNTQYGSIEIICVSATRWEQISPTTALANVVPEFGENNSIVAGQSTTSTTPVDMVGSAFTIPSAGTWDVNYYVSCSTNNASFPGHFYLYTAADVLVPFSATQSSSTGQTGASGGTSASMSVRVVTTGPASYKLKYDGRAGIQVIINNSDNVSNADSVGRSKITWEKISGFLPVTGQSVDYIQAKLSANASQGTSSGNVIINQIVAGNIPLDTATGIFTLSPNKTYELEAVMASGNGTASGVADYNWFNVTTNQNILNSPTANSLNVSSPNNNTAQPSTKVFFTPLVTTQVRVVWSNSINNQQLLANNSYVVIKQLGTTATIGVASTVGAVPGQKMFCDATTDIGFWYLCDGRAISTLPVAVQAVAASVGYVGNIPDMRGRTAMGADGTLPYGSFGGSNIIAQNQLPNINLGPTSMNAIYIGGNQDNNASVSGNSGFAAWENGSLISGWPSTAGRYFDAHLNGNVTQQPFNPRYYASNWFVWLGPGVNAVTMTQPLTLTTTGSGLATFNSGTGNLNIPAPAILSGTYATGTVTTMGTLGGVTFTFIAGSDPCTLQTSSPATGFVISHIYGGGSSAGATVDAWSNVSPGVAGSILVRARQFNGILSGGFGLNNGAYFADWSGALTISGKLYRISGGSANGQATMIIEMVN